MDLAAKVARLEQAQGDPKKLTLAAVDIALSDREPWLREALEAAAIPHWFTAEILGGLLRVDLATSERYLAALESLPFVERFESRGGWNVHEATRLALRDEWATHQVVRFQEVSAQAAELFDGDEPHQQVEQIYHRLVANPVAAEKTLYDLWNKWDDAGRFEPLQALAAALSELLENTPLQPLGDARARLCLGLIQCDRIPSEEIEKLVRKSLEVFIPTEDRQAEVDARELLGSVLFSQGRRVEALHEYQEFKRIMLDLTERDPGNTRWLRELSVSHSHVGRVLEAEGRREEALREYQEFKRIMLDLTERDPGNTVWLRDLSVSHKNVGRVLEAEGRREEALREYQESKRIMLDLTARDPGNTGWLQDLAIAHNRIGSFLAESPETLADALSEHTQSLILAERLAQVDPGNRQWADLPVTCRAWVSTVRRLIDERVQESSASA